jgi:integrase
MPVRLFRRRKGGKPTGPWYAWGYDHRGQRWSESTKQIDEKAAREIARELERRHASPAAARAAQATLKDAVTLLLAHRRGAAKAGKRSDATVTFYEQKTGHWRRILGDGYALADLDADAVDRVIAERREDKASESTISKELVALRCALKLAVRAGIWQGNPAAVLPVGFSAGYEPRTRWLTSQEVELVLSELPPNAAAMVAFMLATGARWSEAEAAQREDVDGVLVRLRGTKTAGAARVVPVLDAEGRGLLAYALKHGGGEGAALFALWKSPGNALRRACERAKIPHASFNDLRRTFSQRLRQAGVSAELIAPAMGHTTTAMVQRVYGRLPPQALEALLRGALGGAADVQQTELHRVDSADASDAPQSKKALESRALRGG